YARAGKQAAIFGEPYIFRCPAGLIEWAAPIIIDGEHLGSIICGQVLMWEPEDFFWIELKEMNKHVTDNFDPLIKAARELTVVSGTKVQAAADLLYVTANFIMKAGWESLRQRRELARQQSRMNEEIQNRKVLEQKLNSQRFDLTYSLEKERELISKIRLGDIESANNIFSEMLAEIFINGAAQIHVVKARVLELSVVISRAAVEGGAEFEAILKINTEFLQEISRFNTFGEINLGAVQVLEKYLDAVRKHNNVKNHQIVSKVMDFIRSNYHRNLTLEEIAGAVFLSPYYVSRVFKEDQKLTIMDYLTKVRLEEAKKLLKNPRYNIDDIAEKLGYNDPSYFSKVFRRKEGMSPSKFRQMV
ncbi:MAG TPA: PocR ligand-binding domain-containing protein, partial [Desulfobacteria bacterium]|nr:PocR ligand-binding domain-containing protein [Desulfobacteria bacterium]